MHVYGRVVSAKSQESDEPERKRDHLDPLGWQNPWLVVDSSLTWIYGHKSQGRIFVRGA